MEKGKANYHEQEFVGGGGQFQAGLKESCKDRERTGDPVSRAWNLFWYRKNRE